MQYGFLHKQPPSKFLILFTFEMCTAAFVSSCRNLLNLVILRIKLVQDSLNSPSILFAYIYTFFAIITNSIFSPSHSDDNKFKSGQLGIICIRSLIPALVGIPYETICNSSHFLCLFIEVQTQVAS